MKKERCTVAKWDVTLTITVEADSQIEAGDKGRAAINSIDNTLICREIMDVGEPVLVEEDE
jgi:hypothetical protein